MTPIMLQALAFIAAAAVFLRAEPALNRMGRACRLSIRVAFLLLATGSVALMAAIITQGYVPSVPTALTYVGAALLMLADRRTHTHTRSPGGKS